MSKDSKKVGFFGMLTLLFIGLKLTNYITWSWIWILSPLWLFVAINLGVILIFFLGISILSLIKNKKRRKNV